VGPGHPQAAAVVTLALVVAGGWIPTVRVRWRRLSGGVGLHLSRDLRPGDRAWYIVRDASLVVVTARRGARVMIARPDLVEDEVIGVRRTRVFLLPCDEQYGGPEMAGGPGGGPERERDERTDRGRGNPRARWRVTRPAPGRPVRGGNTPQTSQPRGG